MKGEKSVPKVSSAARKRLLMNLRSSAAHPASGSSATRFVVDTSVLVSAPFFGGHAQELLLHVAQKQTMLLSSDIVDEFVAFARKTDPKTSHQTLRLMRQILTQFIYEYDKSVSVKIRDVHDVHLLQLAHQYNASIISSDNDLLTNRFDASIAILSIDDYCQLFGL